jgi:hypothetical protein
MPPDLNLVDMRWIMDALPQKDKTEETIVLARILTLLEVPQA